MRVIAKNNRNENNLLSFNISRRNNEERFPKLLQIIDKIEFDGFKSNLSRSTKYPDNLYFSVYNSKSLNITLNEKYKIKIRTSKPTKKNYVNIIIDDVKPYTELMEYSDYI